MAQAVEVEVGAQYENRQTGQRVGMGGVMVQAGDSRWHNFFLDEQEFVDTNKWERLPRGEPEAAAVEDIIIQEKRYETACRTQAVEFSFRLNNQTLYTDDDGKEESGPRNVYAVLEDADLIYQYLTTGHLPDDDEVVDNAPEEQS